MGLIDPRTEGLCLKTCRYFIDIFVFTVWEYACTQAGPEDK